MGATYYVSPGGSDSNNGLSGATALGTLQYGVNILAPGDTLLALSGTYRNSDYDSASPSYSVAWLSQSGTPASWITIKAAPGANPVILFNGWSGFGAQTACYIEINGFQIIGNNDNVTYSYAYAQRNTANPLCNGSGISLDGRNQGSNHPHHFRILNNSISKCGGEGISAIQSDYITIQGNQIFDNSWYTIYATSGISTYQDWGFDSGTGYKMFITANLVYNNRTLIPWQATGQLSDGNGIIVDDSRNTQNGSTIGPYAGRTLVANNVSVNNGGSGIHAYSSDHVDIVNNTTWCNSQVLDYGEIFANTSGDVNILNNICVAASGKPMNANDSNTNVTYDYNIYHGGNAPVVEGPHDLTGDPLLINPQADPTTGDFRIPAGSPAIDSGTSAAFVPSTDYRGFARPVGAGYDRGAYEIANVSNAQPAITVISSQPYPGLIYTRWADPSNTRYTVQASSDLVAWISGASVTTVATLSSTASGMETVTVRDNSPLGSQPGRFYRVIYSP